MNKKVLILMLVFTICFTSCNKWNDENIIAPESTIAPESAMTPETNTLPENYPLCRLDIDTVAVSSRVKADNPREVCWVHGDNMADKLGVDKVLVWAFAGTLVVYAKDARVLDEFNRMLVEDYGCDFIVEFHDYARTNSEEKYLEEIETVVKRKEQIDIINTGSGSKVYKWLVNNELAEKWDDEFETEQGKLIKQVYPDAVWYNTEYKDGIYGFTNRYFPMTMSWLIADKDNVKEYEALLDEYKNIFDVDKILKNVQIEDGICPFVYDSNSVLNVLGYCDNGYGIYLKRNENGKYTAINIADEESVLKLWEMLYSYTQSGMAAEVEHIKEAGGYKEVVEAGNYIFYCGWGDSKQVYNDMIFNNLANDIYAGKECIILERDYSYFGDNRRYINCIMQSSEYKEEALKLISILATEQELSNLLKYGIEGIHYMYEDGEIIEFKHETGKKADISEVYNAEASTPRTNETENLSEYIVEYSNCFAFFPMGTFDELYDKYSVQMSEIKKIIEEYSDLFGGYEVDVRGKAAELSKKLKEAGIDEINAYINENLVDKINAY